MRRHVMCNAFAVMLVVCTASSARADKPDKTDDAAVPDTDPADAKAARDVGTLLTDGKGHYLAFTGPDPDPVDGAHDERKIFYGDGKVFFLVEVGEFGWSSGIGEWSISDGRSSQEGWRSTLRRKHGAYSMTCRSKDNPTVLTPLASADARKLLAKAAFKERRLQRKAFALGRDGTTYYYVDNARRPDENSDFRLYVGKRGGMKRLKIKHINNDTDGVLLTAKEGTLRITVKPKPTALSWGAKPSKQVGLTLVPTESNSELIYNELGVYTGVPFGVPCDDM